MQPLTEKWRPKRWEDVVGQGRAIQAIRNVADTGGLAARSWWLSGPSGTGKTTLARLIAAEVADRFCTEEMDASELTAKRLRGIEETAHLYGWGKGGRAYIVNEAHGLRADTIRKLLVVLETMPTHCIWIFTTTHDGQEALFDDHADAGPLLSRCIRIELARRNLSAAFAKRAKTIAMTEHLDGKPLAYYIGRLKEHRNNLRAVIQEIEAGRMQKQAHRPA